VTYKYAVEAEVRGAAPKTDRAARSVIRRFDRQLEEEPRAVDPMVKIREEARKFQAIPGFTVDLPNA